MQISLSEFNVSSQQGIVGSINLLNKEIKKRRKTNSKTSRPHIQKKRIFAIAPKNSNQDDA